MRDGTLVWRRELAPEARRVARGLGRQARRPHDGRGPRLRPAPQRREGALVLERRLARRVVAARRRRDRLLRLLERPRLRARPAAAPAALDVHLRLQDHLQRRRRGRAALRRRLRRPAPGAHALGRLAWSRSVGGRIYGTPAVAGGRVFVPSSTGGSLTAFSTSGRYLWRLSTGSYVYSSPATWGGRVFVGSYNGVFYCLSARVGSRPLGGRRGRADLRRGGRRRRRRLCRQLRPSHRRRGRADGTRPLTFPHGEYVPVSGGGTRLLLHGYSRLYAVESQALWLRTHRHLLHARLPARHHRRR